MKKCITDINVSGKRCLVRCDFNVPISEGQITDDNRIVGAVPTINYLMSKGAKIVLCSHLGRPKGKFNAEFSLKPVAERLSKLLKVDVKLATDIVGDSAQSLVRDIKDGEVILLENLRFHSEEEANDTVFSQKLANFADIYVNDAFGTAHRAHASTEGVSHYVKDSVSGLLIAKELEIMGQALSNPVRPFVAILGGSKVSDKIGVISNLLTKVDTLIIGGAMAYTFIKAKGGNIGKSLCELDKIELANKLLETAKANNVKLLLPVDSVVADAFNNDAKFKTTASNNIPDDYMGLDIGVKAIKEYTNEIQKAKTIIWNGPMGVFEMPNFANGTFKIAQAISQADAISIVGGGDSASAVINMGFADKITHISTGGGASLEFLEGLVLPGIDCLNEKS